MKRDSLFSLIKLLVLIIVTSSTTYSDFVTDDGIKVQLFKSKNKKPIPLKLYNLKSKNENGFQEFDISVNEPIEKIVFNGYYDDYHEYLSYKMTVYNLETNTIVLLKDTMTFTFSKSFEYGQFGKQYNGKEKGTTYIFSLIPWIDNKGKYLIMIERNNLFNDEHRLISITYTIE